VTTGSVLSPAGQCNRAAQCLRAGPHVPPGLPGTGQPFRTLPRAAPRPGDSRRRVARL